MGELTVKCVGCNLAPADIPEYVDAAQEDGYTPEEYVRMYEGTYNPIEGVFWCTECYIRVGQPLGVAYITHHNISRRRVD